jgi:hypothetical protein
MGAEPFVQSADVGKRASRRARVLLAAKLQTPEGEIDCRLRDLSRMGALLECKPQPAVGSRVVFLRGKVAIPARVAWNASDRIGVEFEHPIDEQEMLVQLKHGPRADIPEFYKRIGRTMSVEERRHIRKWTTAMGLATPEGEG